MPTRHLKRGLQVISESTVIPISLVIVLIGGIFWLTTIWAKGNANAAALKELQDDRKSKREEYVDTLKMINENLTSLKEDVAFLKGKASK